MILEYFQSKWKAYKDDKKDEQLKEYRRFLDGQANILFSKGMELLNKQTMLLEKSAYHHSMHCQERSLGMGVSCHLDMYSQAEKEREELKVVFGKIGVQMKAIGALSLNKDNLDYEQLKAAYEALPDIVSN